MPDDQTPQTPNNNQNPPPASSSGGGFNSSLNQKPNSEELDFGTLDATEGKQVREKLIREFRFGPQDGGRNIPNQNINLNNLKPLKSFTPNPEDGGSSQPQNFSRSGINQNNQRSLRQQDQSGNEDKGFQSDSFENSNLPNKSASGSNNQPEDLKNQKKLYQQNQGAGQNQQQPTKISPEPQLESPNQDISDQSDQGQAEGRRLSDQFAQNDARMAAVAGAQSSPEKRVFEEQQTENFSQPNLGTPISSQTSPVTGPNNVPGRSTAPSVPAKTSQPKSGPQTKVQESVPSVSEPGIGSGTDFSDLGIDPGDLANILSQVASGVAQNKRPLSSEKVIEIGGRILEKFAAALGPEGPFIVKILVTAINNGYLETAGISKDELADAIWDESSFSPQPKPFKLLRIALRVAFRYYLFYIISTIALVLTAIFGVIIFLIIVFVALCQLIAKAPGGEYAVSISAALGELSGRQELTFCKSINNAYTNVASFGGGGGGTGGGGPPVGTIPGNGACKIITTGPCSESYLYAFGQEHGCNWDARAMSQICFRESGGKSQDSQTDRCANNKNPDPSNNKNITFSTGLYQINLFDSTIGFPECSKNGKPLLKSYDGTSLGNCLVDRVKVPGTDITYCPLRNCGLAPGVTLSDYEVCRSAVQDANRNLLNACGLHKSRGVCPWVASATACGVIAPGACRR